MAQSDAESPAYREVARILRRGECPDAFTNSLYAFSPYQACAHACAYCDGRAEKYWVEGDFARDIVVRRNLPELLPNELGKLRERGIVSIGSGITDVYQPIEATEKLTALSARILADHHMPTVLLTKSALVRRDLPVWQEVAHSAGMILYLTITTLNEETRRIYEPGAAAIQDRLAVLRDFRAAGIHAGVLAMPILPYISDSPSDLETLFAACQAAGAEFIMPGSLTLRPGRQKEYFLNVLTSHHPKLLGAYRELYAEDRLSGSPRRDFLDSFRQRCGKLLSDLGMPMLVPQRIYRGMVPMHDEILILLGHMEAIYASVGVDVRSLRISTQRYSSWLKTQRAWYRRKRSLPDYWLDERFAASVSSGELADIINNSRLWQFICQVVNDKYLLDYCSRKLGSC